jgi:hypothetical protein
MEPYQITASALIQAPAEQIYGILGDYRNGHPHILPKPYFRNLEIEQGGVGAGTIVRFQMRVLGRTQSLRVILTEPEPGRVLAETDLASGAVTTFTIQPLEGEPQLQAQTTITTELKSRTGLAGLLERFLTRLMLRRIYRQELALLATFVKEGSGVQVATLSGEGGYL